MRRPRRHAALVILALALALALAGCAQEGEEESAAAPTLPTVAATPTVPAAVPGPDAEPTPGADDPADAAPTEIAPPTAGAEPDDASADIPDLDGLTLGLREVAVLDAPTAMAVRDGDPHLYVTERAGTVRAIAPDGTVGPPLIDISDDTVTNSERGLLGLAWAPAGDRLYLSSSDVDGATMLEGVDVEGTQLRADSRVEILRVPQPAANHNGGDVAIGPDGMLWLALGDGGGADDQFGQGQRPDTLLAAMLRIDPDGDPYAIPADNPFADGGGGAPEVWAYGLRNPWRFSFDRLTDELWIADVGQNAVEEINRVPADQAGLNYGWPRFEGDRPFDGAPVDGPVVEPVHTYGHDRGCSITGGYVYRGDAIPALRGAYLYSDFCSGTIWALDVAEDGTVRADVDTGLQVDAAVSFGEGPDGELHVLSLNGPVHVITQE